MNGSLFAPDFANHTGSSFTGNIGSYTPFTPVSQSPITGTGTAADPRKVTTTVSLGSTGVEIVETDSYVTGLEYYGTTINVRNTTGSAKNIVVYRAGDCYLQNSDTGFGFSTSTHSVGCSANPNNSPPGRVEVWTPATAGASFLESTYSSVWSAIGSHNPFPNICAQCTNNVDNGAGLSWSLSVGGSSTSSVSLNQGFSPTGQLPPGTTGRRSSATGIRCDYIIATHQDTCFVTVADPVGGGPAPTGSVSFTSNAGGTFVAGSTCHLSVSHSTPGSADCSVEFIPPATQSPQITAVYSGDSNYASSSATSVSLIPQSVGNLLSGFGIAPSAIVPAPGGPSIARKKKYGGTVRFTLAGPAKVRFTVQKAMPGRKGKGGRCSKPTTKNAGKKKCIRWVTMRGSFSIVGHQGKNHFRFRGRIGGKKLKPGRYRLVGTPSIAGVKGTRKFIKFRVKKY